MTWLTDGWETLNEKRSLLLYNRQSGWHPPSPSILRAAASPCVSLFCSGEQTRLLFCSCENSTNYPCCIVRCKFSSDSLHSFELNHRKFSISFMPPRSGGKSRPAHAMSSLTSTASENKFLFPMRRKFEPQTSFLFCPTLFTWSELNGLMKNLNTEADNAKNVCSRKLSRALKLRQMGDNQGLTSWAFRDWKDRQGRWFLDLKCIELKSST